MKLKPVNKNRLNSNRNDVLTLITNKVRLSLKASTIKLANDEIWHTSRRLIWDSVTELVSDSIYHEIRRSFKTKIYFGQGFNQDIT